MRLEPVGGEMYKLIIPPDEELLFSKDELEELFRVINAELYHD